MGVFDGESSQTVTLGRLPPGQAFVVQFQEGATDDPAQSRGRIEHVLSGRSLRFVGWEAEGGLVAALQELLRQVA